MAVDSKTIRDYLAWAVQNNPQLFVSLPGKPEDYSIIAVSENAQDSCTPADTRKGSSDVCISDNDARQQALKVILFNTKSNTGFTLYTKNLPEQLRERLLGKKPKEESKEVTVTTCPKGRTPKLEAALKILDEDNKTIKAFVEKELGRKPVEKSDEVPGASCKNSRPANMEEALKNLEAFFDDLRLSGIDAKKLEADKDYMVCEIEKGCIEDLSPDGIQQYYFHTQNLMKVYNSEE